MKNNKKIAMELLRKAALALAQVERNVLFPGWDWDNSPNEQIARYAKIIQASRGITADHVDYDHGTNIPTTSLSYLVQYIGDMLEEWKLCRLRWDWLWYNIIGSPEWDANDSWRVAGVIPARAIRNVNYGL